MIFKSFLQTLELFMTNGPFLSISSRDFSASITGETSSVLGKVEIQNMVMRLPQSHFKPPTELGPTLPVQLMEILTGSCMKISKLIVMEIYQIFRYFLNHMILNIKMYIKCH